VSVILSTDFPGGNGVLLGVDESSAPVVVRFGAEPRNSALAMWFHFRLTNLAGRAVRVILANAEQTLGGPDWSGNRIVYRPAGGEWIRCEAAVAVDTGAGRTEWAWDIPAGGDAVEVAHCFPYQLADLEATLAELGGAFKTTTIGLSLGGRPMLRVYNRVPDKSSRGAFLTVRQHAGETPGSWVLDGLLRHVAAAPKLLDRIAWWMAPLVNIDDIVTGAYGKDPFPHDINRAYGPGAPRRPEAAAVAGDMTLMHSLCGRMFLADLHAPAHHERQNYVPLRGWDDNATISPVAEPFAVAFYHACPEDIRSPIIHITPGPGLSRYRGSTANTWASQSLKIDAVSVELSYQGNEQTYYTIDDYRRLGAALAKTIGDWLFQADLWAGADTI
jgi:hypothetical protein